MPAPPVRWLGNSDIIRHIQAANPALPAPAYTLGPPMTAPDGYGTNVARYRSLAEFQADIADTTLLDHRYRWVLYDPENWDDTPPAEQQDPWTWLPRFGQYAHAHGYRVIAAPARDLGNVAGSVHPKMIGVDIEDISGWYLRTAVARFAATHAEVVSIQSQALTEDAAYYEMFVTAAARQAKIGNPFVKVFAGISTRYGTPAQMAAAAKAVHVDGFWLNVPGPAPDIAGACEWLQLMTGGT